MINIKLFKKLLQKLREVYPDSLTVKKIKDELNISKEEYDKLIIYGEGSGYINCYYKGKELYIKVEITGLDYLKELEKENSFFHKWIDRKQIIPLLFTVLVGIVLAFYSHSLQQPYMQLVNPDITLYPNTNEKIPELSAQQMAEERFLPGEKLELCIKNQGKTDTGQVNVFLENYWAYSETWNFQNITSGTYKCVDGYIRQNECHQDGNCNISLVPEGIVKLNFRIRCNNCEPRIFSDSFNVCIWHKSNAICKI